MKSLRQLPLFALLAGCLLLSSCGGQQQPHAYSSQLDSNDSLLIEMGQWTLTRYHSTRLGFDINYPSCLQRLPLPETAGQQEVFQLEDVTLSIMTETMDSIYRTPGQQLMGMGADLVTATDRYSIHRGQEDEFEYYGKVIDDSLRFVTVILRYHPNHADAMIAFREWVDQFDVTP
ncbi:MAG: hypothetical protein K5764_10150 [Prevotella sp.]|nr:hypothetical protein [Prevotella sp.]